MGHPLVLPPTTDAAATARRHVQSTLRATPIEELADDAALAVTELVTNVLLHTDSEVRVDVDVAGDTVRVAVSDSSPVLPVPGLLDPAGASGRGLVLVERLTQRWGVTKVSGGGKSVWFEMVAGVPEVDVELTADELIGAWASDVDLCMSAHPSAQEGDEDRSRLVVIEDVPTRLLVATKARLDDVVRELTLVSCGEDASLPEDLRALVTRLRHLTVELAYFRQEVRRQARDAAARGDETMTLRIELLPSEAPLLRDYRDALDEADELCRAQRLLLDPTDEESAAFRRWKLDRVIEQLSD